MKAELLVVEPNGWVPNNSLPVIIYRGVEDACGRNLMAAAFERRFTEHGWPPQWRDTVFDYHHYHSTAHEVLGVASGSATLEIGGPRAQVITVVAGDAVVIPVGVGHRRVDAGDDFQVVGAYPEGEAWDSCREEAGPDVLARIRDLPLPPMDPVQGRGGITDRLWS